MRISDWSADVCSSDLQPGGLAENFLDDVLAKGDGAAVADGDGEAFLYRHLRRAAVRLGDRGGERSEEHTSELQSLMRTSYAVFCLKKKTMHTQSDKHTHRS